MVEEPGGVTDLLARHSELIDSIGEMRWHEWGGGGRSLAEWIDVTRREAGEARLPITLVAIDPVGGALGAVALGDVDSELSGAERGGRTPWVLGMIVRADCRRRGIGRQLLDVLGRTAGGRGCRTLWVATGDPAVGFYRNCGWEPVQRLRLLSTGIETTILTKSVSRH